MKCSHITICLLLSFILYDNSVRAQSISPSSINSQSALYLSGNLQVSTSLGLSGYLTLSSGSVVLSQGFQQPSLVNVSIERLEKSNFWLFPNPSSGVIFLDEIREEINLLKIFNAQGQLQINERLKNSLHNSSLDLSHLADGLYFAELSGGSKKKARVPFIISK